MGLFQGLFKPKNPKKYRGNPSTIMYRSSWEFKLMCLLDTHAGVLRWSSEEIVIPYISPIDGKTHRYFPDFWVEKYNKDGVIQEILIEVKPMYQTIEPKRKADGKITRQYIREVYEYGINDAKWEAARKYCSKRGWDFVIMTEKELDIKT